MTVNDIKNILIDDFGIDPLDLLYMTDAAIIILYNELIEIKNRVTARR